MRALDCPKLLYLKFYVFRTICVFGKELFQNKNFQPFHMELNKFNHVQHEHTWTHFF